MGAARTALLLGVLLPPGLAAQGGALRPPQGWKVVLDDPRADAASLRHVDMPPGWRLEAGPAAILWDTAWSAGGDFRIEMEVYLFDPEQRATPFGFFVGGHDLEGPGATRLELLVREGGQRAVVLREGPRERVLRPWADTRTMRSWRERPSDALSVRNVLALEVRDERIRFFVNGREVARLPRAHAPVDGTWGLRVGGPVSLHVSRLEVQASGP